MTEDIGRIHMPPSFHTKSLLDVDNQKLQRNKQDFVALAYKPGLRNQ